jgi:hypothetical protein
MTDGQYGAVPGFTGRDVRAARVSEVPFPTLLDPVDDLPPATIITAVCADGDGLLVRGVSQDNGEIAGVTVNGKAAKITSSHAGVADWEIRLARKGDEKLVATATDAAGNAEKTGAERRLGPGAK